MGSTTARIKDTGSCGGAVNWYFVANVALAIGLYLWFKITEKNLLDDWWAIFKDGIASGAAFVWLGANIQYFYDGWLDYLGWFLVAWSLTYWTAVVIAWQKIQAAKKGQKVAKPLTAEASAPKVPLNRQQRRRVARKK